ncbi:MAG: TonB-dependent receptor plug domain-containing protein [Bacteroidota bacterium]
MLTPLNAQQSGDRLIGGERLGTGDLEFRKDTVKELVVSASRSNKLVDDLPITIHVITREEITMNHYNSLTDILKTLPGVRVSQPGSGQLGENFQIRGLTGNLYTMILINGLPVKPSVVSGMPIASQLPVRQAERIEVIYGPAAAVYGADAVSGVINIITREADRATFAMGDISLGQNEYMHFDFMAGGKAGTNKNILQYSFYGNKTGFQDMNVKEGYEDVYNPLQYLQSKGETVNLGSIRYEPLQINEHLLENAGIDPGDFIRTWYPPNYEGSLTMPLMEELPAESNSLGLRLKYRDFTFSFNNMYRRTHSSLGQSTYLYKYNDPRTFWGETIRNTALSYNKNWGGRINTTTQAQILTYKMDNNSSQGVTFIPAMDKVYRYSASNDLLLEQLITLWPLNDLEVVAGVSYQYSGNLPETNYLGSPFNTRLYRPFSKSVSYNDSVMGNFGINPLTFSNASLFAQGYYTIKKFHFMGGLRFDRNSLYGNSLSPRIAGIYKMTNRTSFRSSLGYAYKAPPSSMAYQSLAYPLTDVSSIVYQIVPNPQLSPEKYISFEMGMNQKLRTRSMVNISVYYNRIFNLVLDQNILLSELNLPNAYMETDTSTVLTRVNNREAISRLYGIQATFFARELIESVHLDAELSLTFAKSSEQFPDLIKIAGDFLSDFTLTPNHYGQLKVSMKPAPQLYISVSSIWESNWLRVLIPFEEIYNELFKNVDGFYTMDVTASYIFNENLHAFVQVNNVFNEEYGGTSMSWLTGRLPYTPQLRRNIRFGINFTLN